MSDRPCDSEPPESGEAGAFAFHTNSENIRRPVVDIWTRQYVRMIPRDGALTLCADCQIDGRRISCRRDHIRDDMLLADKAVPPPQTPLAAFFGASAAVAAVILGALWLIARP
jgi:hypothetical protein